MRYLTLLLLFPLVALADNRGTDIEQEVGVEVVGGTYNVSGSRAYGLSGGDMDINDCLATHSVLFGLWQSTHVNKLCVADQLNRDGQFRASAEMRCSVRAIRKVYPKGQCVESVMISAQPAPPPEPVAADIAEDCCEEEEDEETHWQEEQEWHDEQIQMQQEYDARIARLESRLNQPPPPDKDAERRAKSRASLAEFQKIGEEQ